MPQLRDGSVVEDVRLDRLRQFDPRSRDFPVTALELPAELRSKTWSLSTRLDQGRQGACVGFGITHELAAAPNEVRGLGYDFATRLYREAQKIDPWPGEAYEGTSVLAGMKVGQRLGYFREYRWCFGIEDVLRTLQTGPVVVGTWWKNSMWQPRPSGLIEGLSGGNDGGHCYMLRGLTLKPRLRGESRVGPIVRITNSWGPHWGVNGEAFLRVSDLESLLNEDGEAVVAVGRVTVIGRKPRSQAAERTRPRFSFEDPLRYWRWPIPR